MEYLEKTALESAPLKPSHWFRDRYLHALSNHHPAQKRAVISTLVHRSKTLSGPDTLASELKHLAHALSANGYHHKLFREALHPKTPTPPQDKPHHDNPSGRILLPFIPGTTDRIGKILRKANINTFYTPTTKISQLLRNPKDPLDPKRFPGIYSIPCQCTKVYIGMTQRPIATRITEHERHLRLGHTDQSAVAEHSIQCDHNILFNQTQVKARISQPRLLPFREAIEIAKTPNNFNRDQGHPINPIWLPLLLPPTQTS
ncbi:UNVERIFIED_CONTAM: hypothetical protein PYX00_008078 [Menopon gallinae]|uniref:Helix-turn-helix domain-containing protein n=1 Tax=Menopon gallinae TaxID=328185 RepID=A0AAW2HLI4_9NEOP